MTTDEIIEGILKAEGPGDPAKGYLAKNDRGGRTNWGISEKAHPEEWANGKVPSRERAAEIYRDVYVLPFLTIPDDALRAQLVDWCVLHGEGRTWRWVARAIGSHVNRRDPGESRNDLRILCTYEWGDEGCRHFNNALVATRLKMMRDIVDADPAQAVNKRGWEKRALSFLILD